MDKPPFVPSGLRRFSPLAQQKTSWPFSATVMRFFPFLRFKSHRRDGTFFASTPGSITVDKHPLQFLRERNPFHRTDKRITTLQGIRDFFSSSALFLFLDLRPDLFFSPAQRALAVGIDGLPPLRGGLPLNRNGAFPPFPRLTRTYSTPDVRRGTLSPEVILFPIQRRLTQILWMGAGLLPPALVSFLSQYAKRSWAVDSAFLKFDIVILPFWPLSPLFLPGRNVRSFPKPFPSSKEGLGLLFFLFLSVNGSFESGGLFLSNFQAGLLDEITPLLFQDSSFSFF